MVPADKTNAIKNFTNQNDKELIGCVPTNFQVSALCSKLESRAIISTRARGKNNEPKAKIGSSIELSKKLNGSFSSISISFLDVLKISEITYNKGTDTPSAMISVTILLPRSFNFSACQAARNPYKAFFIV